MGRLRAIRLAAAVVLLATVGAGCAARWAYRQGQDARDRGEWDLAVARYTKALDKDSSNITYKIALENARIQASRLHYDLGRRAIAAADFPKAVEELEIASKYDPANRSAADDLALVRQKIRKQEDDQRDRAEFEQRRARQAASRLPVPVLSPRTMDKVRLQFKDANLRTVFETLGKLANVNVLFDEAFPNTKRVDVNLTGVTFQEALDQLTFANRLFYKVVDQNTIIIVPESRQKRLAYDEQVLRTFFLQNAEVNDTVNLVKSLAKPPGVVGNVGLGAVTVLGTIEQMAMAERIIDQNDKPRGEVMVEVQILEVDRTKTKQWGIDLSNYQVSATLSPTGAAGELGQGALNIRPQFLSSLNQGDWILALPSTVFFRFLQNDSTVRILASPRLRAAEGKPTELKIGTEVPIPVTSYTVGVGNIGNTGGYFPATSFQYRNVGVNLVLTPRVSAGGDIQLEITAEFSLLGQDRNVGSTTNAINVPTFLTRNVKGLLRLRDGETGLIGGLLQSADTTSFNGALGIDNVPVIGKLFGNRSKKRDEQEVLISITPRIVRGPKVTEDDLTPMRVGTSEVPHVEGARPGLFGPETPPAAAGAAPRPNGTAPGQTAPYPTNPPAGTGAPAGTEPVLPAVPPPPPGGSSTPQPVPPGTPGPLPVPGEPGPVQPPGTAVPGTPPPGTTPPIAQPPQNQQPGTTTNPPQSSFGGTAAGATLGGIATAAPSAVTPGATTAPATSPSPGTTGTAAVAPATTTAPTQTPGGTGVQQIGGVVIGSTPGTPASGSAAAPAGGGTTSQPAAGVVTSSAAGPGMRVTATPAAAGATTATVADTRPLTTLFSPTEASLRVGQSAGVAVVLVGATDVQSVDMTVAYDPAVVHVTDVSAGSLLTLDGTSVGKQQALEVGRARVRFTRTTGASGSGAVAALSVRGLKPGSATLSIESLTVGHAGGTTEQPPLPAPGRVVVAP